MSGTVLDWDEAPDLVTALVPIPFDTAPLVAVERAAVTHRLSMSTREQSRMTGRIFVFDTEATSRTPMSGVMTEVGLVDLQTLSWFYLHLWPFSPHPDTPALPVVADGASPDVYSFSGTVIDGARRRTGEARHESLAEGLESLAAWAHDVSSAAGGHPVLMSDNPAFDFMWLVCSFDEQGVDHPFGFSARRIGDLAAGLSGSWRSTSRWKRLRVTKHTHDPVDDAMGNAEALRSLLAAHRQQV